MQRCRTNSACSRSASSAKGRPNGHSKRCGRSTLQPASMPCSSQCTSVADRPIRIPPVPHDGAAARSAFHQSRMTVPPPCCDSHFHIVDPANKFPCAAERRWQQGRCIVNRWLTAGLLLASVFPAAAADQIKLVVPFAAGGPVDLIARTIAGGLPAKLGAAVIIENRGAPRRPTAPHLAAQTPPH